MPYHSIEDPSRLRRILDAVLLLEKDLELPALLQHVIEEACSMTGARYGALGVLNDDKTALAEFITVGLSAENEAQIGPRPTGKGVLGLLVADPDPLRLARLGDHPESFGFPTNHPPMTSFLGVPVKVRGDIYGNLYLTDKIGWSEFTRDDVALVEALALAAGIAIENTRLHQQVKVSAVYEDRDRLARDLHDHVIQRLFGLGLNLQGMTMRASKIDADRLQSHVSEIDEIIGEIRSTIYALGMGGSSRGVRDDVTVLVAELRDLVGFELVVSFEGAVNTAVSERVAEQLMATIREAVTNIERHANATEASIVLSTNDGHCQLVVSDNGRGMDSRTEGGLGLNNLRRRAEKLLGEFDVSSPPAGGTVLMWRVPYTEG
ncbi:MAG: GAF domain-containing sensor histidine kinase [Acidimicrobiales bacterium]|jgi:signal transduction histidine kinase